MLTKEQQIELAWAKHKGQPAPPLARKQFTRKLREQLAESQNWRCCYCGIRMEGAGNEPDAPTVEHVIPLSLGGSNHRDNLVIACWLCNNQRADRHTAFSLFLASYSSSQLKPNGTPDTSLYRPSWARSILSDPNSAAQKVLDKL